MNRYEILLGRRPPVPPAPPIIPSREKLRVMLKKHPAGSFPSLEKRLLIMDLGASRCVPLPKIAPEGFIPGRPTEFTFTIESTPNYGEINPFFDMWRRMTERDSTSELIK